MEAHAEDIRLNGIRFALKDGVIQVATKQAWADPLRITGNQQRGDRINASQWVMESWENGLGFRSHRNAPALNPGEPQDPSIFGFFDSSVETRFSGQVTLPGLIETVSYGTADNTNDDFNRLFVGVTTNGGIIRKQPYVLPSDTGGEIASITLGVETVNQADDISAIANYAPIAPVNHNGTTYFFGGVYGSAVPAKYRRVNAAGTFSDLTPGTNVSNPIVSAVIFRDIIYVATLDNTNGKIALEYSSDSGSTFTVMTGATTTMGEGGIAQLAVYRDSQGSPALFLQTDDALFLVDISNSYLEPVIQFSDGQGAAQYPSNTSPSSKGLPTNPVVWNGNLYLIRRQSLIEYNFTGSYRDISPLTIGRVPDKYQGSSASAFPKGLVASDNWLYVGLSNGNDGVTGISSIWAYDGQAYHYIWSDTTSAVHLLHDFAICQGQASGNAFKDVLYILYEKAGAADNRNFQKIEDINANPTSLDGTKKYSPTGALISPYHDGGMAEVDSMILGVGMSAEDLDTTANNNEKITVKIATNFSDNFGNDLVFYSDSAVFQKYASGAGLSGKNWAHDFRFARGATNTKSPIMYYPITYFQKVFPDIHTYQFVIDVKKTVELNRNQGDLTSAQGVLRAVEAIHDSVVLVPLTYPGTGIHSSATRYVRMVANPMIQRGTSNPSGTTQEVAGAEIYVTLEEVV